MIVTSLPVRASLFTFGRRRKKKKSSHLQEDALTEHDVEREEIIVQGKAFDHKLGQRIQRMLQQKSAQVEDVSEAETIEIEQQRLAQRIRKELGEE